MLCGATEDDLLVGTDGADVYLALAGQDVVQGPGGDDWHVNGTIGADLVYGGNGAHTMYANSTGTSLFVFSTADQFGADVTRA